MGEERVDWAKSNQVGEIILAVNKHNSNDGSRFEIIKSTRSETSEMRHF